MRNETDDLAPAPSSAVSLHSHRLSTHNRHLSLDGHCASCLSTHARPRSQLCALLLATQSILWLTRTVWVSIQQVSTV